MKPLRLTEDMKAIARRVIWFEVREQALRDPVRFLTYAMTYALHEYRSIIRRYVSDDRSSRGDGKRSYWHNCSLLVGLLASKAQRYPANDLPFRKL
jgi:hypothetical protein